MKRTAFSSLICLLLLAGSISTSVAQDIVTEAYTVAPSSSGIDWEGHKFFGGKHTGTIGVKDGTLQVREGKLTGGTFRIDMNSIRVTDLQGETAEKLAAHLKTDDFFDAANHPLATFVITNVEYGGANQAAIVGDLTLRGVKQELVFLASIDIAGNALQARASGVRVDRTVHDAKYGSARFFRELGRKIVSDEFTLDIQISASR